MRKRTLVYAAALTAAIIGGGALGWFLHKPITQPSYSILRENPSDYQFIDPVLLLSVPQDANTPELLSLKEDMSEYITTVESQHKAADVSVYFRELNNDRWVGVNENDLYAPASMLKVVSLIAFLREVQNNPSLLNESIAVTQDGDNSQDFYPPAHPAQVGQSYPAQELADDMIIDSDNNSAFALNDFIGTENLDKTYTDLQLPNPDQNNNNGQVDYYSPKMFSRFFRSLYNGAYLSDDISNQALELMSKTSFTQGLVSGVPDGTTVAHKFGERTILPPAGSTAPTIRELHDCGIIYAPHDPYLLCIMTKGTDFPSLQKIISTISSMAWKQAQQLTVGK